MWAKIEVTVYVKLYLLNLGMEVEVNVKSCNRGGYCNLNEIVFSFQPFKEAGMYYLTGEPTGGLKPMSCVYSKYHQV